MSNSVDPDETANFELSHLDLPASVAQLDAPSDWRPGDRGFNPHPRSATFFRGDLS